MPESRKYIGVAGSKRVEIFAGSEGEARRLLKEFASKSRFVGKGFDGNPDKHQILHFPSGEMLDYRNLSCVIDGHEYTRCPNVNLHQTKAIILDTRSSKYDRDGNRHQTFEARGLDRYGKTTIYIISDLFSYKTSEGVLKDLFAWLTGLDPRDVLNDIEMIETTCPVPVPMGKLHCRNGRENILDTDTSGRVYTIPKTGVRFLLS